MSFLFFIIYLLYVFFLCTTFSDMHVRTGNYGPDFGHRAEKKARFPANSTRVQRPIDSGAELKPF